LITGYYSDSNFGIYQLFFQRCKIAEAIENHLLQNGFDDIWCDKRKIENDWSREIANALSKKDIVLLIWSENSSKPYCMGVEKLNMKRTSTQVFCLEFIFLKL
jgi:hypothetical protein